MVRLSEPGFHALATHLTIQVFIFCIMGRGGGRSRARPLAKSGNLRKTSYVVVVRDFPKCGEMRAGYGSEVENWENNFLAK